jgi:hypothetical protein
MAKTHPPDLDAIANSEIKFYAIVGAVISLTSALEHRIVDIFQKGLAISNEQASAMLADIRASSIQRDLALTAMQFKVRSDQALAAEWESLSTRITSATGQSGKRNVVGHNPVSSYAELSGALGGAPLGALPIGGGPVWQFFVQVPSERLSGKKPHRTMDFKTLFDAAKSLAALVKDTDAFLGKL